MIMFLFQGLCAQMFLKEKYLRRDILQEFCLSISEHPSTLWGTSLMSSSLSSFSVFFVDKLYTLFYLLWIINYSFVCVLVVVLRLTV